jgi:hypothetical protein
LSRQNLVSQTAQNKIKAISLSGEVFLLLIPRYRLLLVKLTNVWLLKTFLSFMEPKGSLTRSQEVLSRPYPKALGYIHR